MIILVSFKEYLHKDGSTYNAAHALKYVPVSETVDGIERTKEVL